MAVYMLDRSGITLRRAVGRIKAGLLPYFYIWNFIFVYLSVNPNDRMVYYFIKDLARLNLLPLDYHLLGNAPFGRRPYGHSLRGNPFIFEPLNLLFRYVPIPQALPARIEKRGGALQYVFIRAVFYLFVRIKRKYEFFLRRDKLRAVKVKERLARPDHLVGAPDVELFHPSPDLGVYDVNLVLLGLDTADSPYYARHVPLLRLFGFNPYLLYPLGTYAYCAGRGYGRGDFVFIHTRIVHAHRVFHGNGRGHG